MQQVIDRPLSTREPSIVQLNQLSSLIEADTLNIVVGARQVAEKGTKSGTEYRSEGSMKSHPMSVKPSLWDFPVPPHRKMDPGSYGWFGRDS